MDSEWQLDLPDGRPKSNERNKADVRGTRKVETIDDPRTVKLVV